MPQREAPVLLDCDVLVLGAGMSGFAAAVSAARAGVDTVLVEKDHFPGGVATSGLMCSIGNYFVTREGRHGGHDRPAGGVHQPPR